uniref:SFRICE_037028 n=1 Tax=Spodoptera frugiperda TaxID=7108 RepID=A0A2H1W8W5_SPOFR
MAATVATGRCSDYTTFDMMAVWLVDNSRLQKKPAAPDRVELL